MQDPLCISQNDLTETILVYFSANFDVFDYHARASDLVKCNVRRASSTMCFK